MPDDLERQLAAFGETLEAQAGEQVRPLRVGSPDAVGRRRWWALAGSAAAVLTLVVGLNALVGDSGSVSPSIPANSDGAWSPTSSGSTGLPASPATSPVSLTVAGPWSSWEPGLPEPEPGVVRLWVSNQSFDDDPVRITIEVDGQLVVDDAFEVGGQHNWFAHDIAGLEPGQHEIVATSDTGAVIEATFSLPADEPRWVVIDYWYYPGEPAGRHFTARESAEPIVFR